jgi:hypothetical protein
MADSCFSEAGFHVGHKTCARAFLSTWDAAFEACRALANPDRSLSLERTRKAVDAPDPRTLFKRIAAGEEVVMLPVT